MIGNRLPGIHVERKILRFITLIDILYAKFDLIIILNKMNIFTRNLLIHNLHSMV